MGRQAAKPPAIPKRYTRTRKVTFWGAEYTITPAVAKGYLGDGRQILAFQPANTRPERYLIRVDSSWIGDAMYDHIDEVIDALEDEFSEKEREREYLIYEEGVDPEEADLANYPDELGWPALSLDSGYCWWTIEPEDS